MSQGSLLRWTADIQFDILAIGIIYSTIYENRIMKTTIDIPDRLLNEAMELTKAKTKREAVVVAMSEYVRRERMASLTKYAGTFTTLMSNEEIEQLDADEEHLYAAEGKKPYGAD